MYYFEDGRTSIVSEVITARILLGNPTISSIGFSQTSVFVANFTYSRPFSQPTSDPYRDFVADDQSFDEIDPIFNPILAHDHFFEKEKTIYIILSGGAVDHFSLLIPHAKATSRNFARIGQ